MEAFTRGDVSVRNPGRSVLVVLAPKLALAIPLALTLALSLTNSPARRGNGAYEETGGPICTTVTGSSVDCEWFAVRIPTGSAAPDNDSLPPDNDSLPMG